MTITFFELNGFLIIVHGVCSLAIKEGERGFMDIREEDAFVRY